MSLNVCEDAIPQSSRFFNIARTQREAETLGCSIRFVDSHMTPPHASVVPEVMILVIIIDPESDLSFLR